MGFKNDSDHMIVAFDGVPATIVSGTPTELVVLTPAFPAASAASLTTSLTVTVVYEDEGMRPPAWRVDPQNHARRVLKHLYGEAPPPEHPHFVESRRRRQLMEMDGTSTSSGPVNVTLVVPDAFTYSPSLTPSLSSISPASGSQGTVVTITGALLGTPSSDSSVSIGGAVCVPVSSSSWTDTSITCTVGAAAAGTQVVLVTVAGLGLAVTASSPVVFTAALHVSTTSPSTGGFGGGLALSLTGSGFAPLSTGATGVSVCGLPCKVTAATYSAVTCLTPPVTTAQSLAVLSNAAPAVLNGTAFGTGFGSGAPASLFAPGYDGDIETTFKASCWGASCCSVGIFLGPSVVASLTQLQFYPNFQRAWTMRGGMFQASLDGVNYVTLTTLGNIVHDAWTTVPLTVSGTFRYLRYVGPANSQCEVRAAGMRLPAVCRF